jgi:hypothetical protein
MSSHWQQLSVFTSIEAGDPCFESIELWPYYSRPYYISGSIPWNWDKSGQRGKKVKYMVCWYSQTCLYGHLELAVTCYKQPVNSPTSLTWSSKVYPTWSIYMYLMVGFHSRLEKFSVIHFRDVPNTLMFSLITIFMGFLFRRIRSYCL